MAETPFDPPHEHPDPQLVYLLGRNNDAMTLRLRTEGHVGIDELINLCRFTSPAPAPVESSLLATRTQTAFSSRKESTATKHTSASTSYPAKGCTGKSKSIVTSASSLCATQGSASEAEAEGDATRENALVGVGHWVVESSAAAQPLKGPARTRKRQRVNSRPKHKKPPVVICQHRGIACALSDDKCPTVAKPKDLRCSNDFQCFRYHCSEPGHNDKPPLGGETLNLPCAPLSRARLYIVISLVILILLTFALSAFAAHHTGKMRMACTKGIIFSASVLMSFSTVVAMIIARHNLQAALLAGLLEFFVGFSLVVEIHEFMA